MPESKIRRYEGTAVVVTWDAARCIHAAECVHALPDAFDPKAKPWIVPDAAATDALVATIGRCPSGALDIESRDGAAALPIPSRNGATVTADGPNHLRGDLALLAGDGSVALADTRIALCRCGASKNKPLCDGSHREVGFRDPGTLPASVAAPPEAAAGGRLTIKPIANGPLQCTGPLALVGTDGSTAFAESTFLCRCGQSHKKPYCDGTHKKIGFTG